LVRPRDLREAVAWVDRSGVAPVIEDILRPTRRGRPRQLTVRALLVGMKIAVDTAKTGIRARYRGSRDGKAMVFRVNYARSRLLIF
jgi:hypothetical protein